MDPLTLFAISAAAVLVVTVLISGIYYVVGYSIRRRRARYD